MEMLLLVALCIVTVYVIEWQNTDRRIALRVKAEDGERKQR